MRASYISCPVVLQSGALYRFITEKQAFFSGIPLIYPHGGDGSPPFLPKIIEIPHGSQPVGTRTRARDGGMKPGITHKLFIIDFTEYIRYITPLYSHAYEEH